MCLNESKSFHCHGSFLILISSLGKAKHHLSNSPTRIQTPPGQILLSLLFANISEMPRRVPGTQPVLNKSIATC